MRAGKTCSLADDRRRASSISIFDLPNRLITLSCASCSLASSKVLILVPKNPSNRGTALEDASN
jgi:hypothetical protein